MINQYTKFEVSMCTCYVDVNMGVNATGTLGGHRLSAEDARIEAP